jgi:MFS family permease
MIDNIDNAGMYSGLFIAIYSISQILSCGFWGKLSDQLGKKNTIMFGLVTSAILYLFFGLSQNFYLTLFIRFLTMSWSIGIIFGSLIGGNTFGLLFNDYPVLLPSLISIIIYSIASLIIYNFIESDDKKFDIIEYVKNYKYNFLLFDIIELWGDKNIIFSILIYVFVTITDITLSEILPLWMVSTIDNGGLQYTSNQISYIYTVCSVISIFIQPLFIFCDKFFERIMMYRCFIIISMILTVIIPYTSASSKSYLLFCAINILRYVIASWNFSIIYLIISASSEKENVGHINGVAQSFGSVCKVIFPLVFNPLYSWSSNKQKSSYINYHFVFNIVAILYIIPFILSYFINLQKIEIQSKQEINNNNMHSV